MTVLKPERMSGGFLPERRPGDREREIWHALTSEMRELRKEDLESRILNSEEELQEFIPENDRYGPVKIVKEVEESLGEEGYVVYGRENDNDGTIERLAYQCGRSEKIIVASPRIRDFGRGRFGGYRVDCVNCSALLETKDGVIY